MLFVISFAQRCAHADTHKLRRRCTYGICGATMCVTIVYTKELCVCVCVCVSKLFETTK